MSLVRRRAAFAAAAVLVALLGLAAAVGAQDTPSVRVSGSAIAAPLVESVAATSGIEASLNTTGTTAGLAVLCAGDADLALASRPLTADALPFAGHLGLLPAAEAGAPAVRGAPLAGAWGCGARDLGHL